MEEAPHGPHHLARLGALPHPAAGGADRAARERAVVVKLRLDADPEFTKGLDESPDAARLSKEDRQTAVAQALLGNLSVGREKLTYILGISFTSRDPNKAENQHANQCQ